MKLPFKLPKMLIMLLAALPFAAKAQKDTSKISIPVKNRVVNYTQSYIFNKAITQGEAFDRAVKWFSKSFKGRNVGVKIKDAAQGKVTGSGLFKIVTGDNGNYFWLKFDVNITVTDSSYTISLLNFYEKPIESGVTNDYSKIEYRWGDFRRGKPWSVEDAPLFRGLHANATTLIESFRKDMDK